MSNILGDSYIEKPQSMVTSSGGVEHANYYDAQVEKVQSGNKIKTQLNIRIDTIWEGDLNPVKKPLPKLRLGVQHFFRPKNEFIEKDEIRVTLNIQNKSKITCPDGRIDVHFQYVSQQFTSIAFFHERILPGEKFICAGPDKVNKYSSTNALAPGYCLVYAIPHNDDIEILDNRGNPIPRPKIMPLAASKTFFVRDLKTVYAGWALKVSIVALILSSIVLTSQILEKMWGA